MENVKDILKPCMVVEFRNGKMAMVYIIKNNKLIIKEDDLTNNFLSLDNYSSMLTYLYNNESQCTIDKIYGFRRDGGKANEVSTKNRDLLWTRPKRKQMTQNEIEAALGYEIEIIDE